MKKLKSILHNLKISEEKKVKLYSFFENRFHSQQFVYPQEISNTMGLNDNLISRLFVCLTNEDVLEVYTVPFDRQNNFVVVKNATIGVVFKFEEEVEILNENGEPYDNANLEAVAAYKVVEL